MRTEARAAVTDRKNGKADCKNAKKERKRLKESGMESIDIKNIELQAASATLPESGTATAANIAAEPQTDNNQTENDRINFCKELVLKSGVRPVELKFERVYDCFSSAVLGFIGKVYVAGGTLGIISSDEYLPVIETAEQGENVLIKTLSAFIAEENFYMPDLYRTEFFSFPCSSDVIGSKTLSKKLADLIAIEPRLRDKICLVFGGKVLLTDTAALTEFFEDIRSVGVKIAIKDFGDKYMPVTVIGEALPDYLFLKEEATKKAEDKKSFTPVGAIIKYAASLGVNTVAVGATSDLCIRELSLSECFGVSVTADYTGLRSGGGEVTLEEIASEKENED